MIFGMIGFVLAVVTCGQAFAALGPNDVSMGVFSIPKPVDGKDGCTPVITVTTKDGNGCYTTTIQKKLLQSGSCVNDGDEIVRETCDGENGAGGDVTVTEEYVPYPESAQDAPNQEGYLKKLVDGEIVGINRDSCEFGEDPQGRKSKKCKAQGNAKTWPDVTENHDVYQQGDTYIFVISDVEDGFPRYEYTAPRSSDGGVVSRGFTQKVYAYDDGRRVTETGVADECKEYAKPGNQSARVTKCTVQDYQYPASLLTTWVPNTTTYCLGNHLSDCNQYTIPVGAVDVCAGLTSSDNAWETTVSATESEYVAHVYPVGGGTCTTNCTGTVGYKLTKEVMCDGNVRTNTVDDKCSSATAPLNVTCATGYAYQQCTPVDSRASVNSYSGCFPDPLNGKYALKDEIVPVSLAADNDYLYYCKVSDCNVASCWVNGTVGGTPYYNDGNGCWGRVSVQGLQGENGKSCFVTNDGTNWNMCCSPTYAGNDCSIITDDDIINKLNGMMCQVNYTHRYLHDDGNGGFIANTTKDDARGERVIVTNSCNTDTENLDTYYGEDGAPGGDYNPCDGLTAGSAAALTTVRNTTNVYVPHGNGLNGTTTGIGYYTETNVMCDTDGNKIVKKYDKCDPVSLASGASRTVGGKTCSGNQTLLMCTPQEEPTTPYYVCSDAEVTEYPKLVYVAPTVNDGKFTARGYTKWVHKYTSSGAEVDGAERHNPDECHTVYKRTFGMADNGTGVRTATTTTQSTLKCKVQTPGTTVWGVGTEYCLNTTDSASTSCVGYAESTSDVITSTLRYHLPIMGTGANSNKPLKPGYTYNEEASGAVAVRGTNQEYDKCETLLTRTNSGSSTVTASVTRCTVGAPTGTPGLASPYTAEALYCLGYANGTCPDGLIDIGSAIDDAAENDPCAGISGADNLARAVKKVVSRTYTRSTNSQGALTSVYKMCDDTDHTESTADECKEVVPTPAGQTCTNGVWMQCKRQADEGTASATARGTTYGYCAAYPQCVGNESSTTIVKKTERAYTAPTKTGTNSYYNTPGKMVTNKIPCNSSASAIVDSSEDDQCEEIPDTSSICPANKVLKTCKRKGDENSTDKKAETTYNLCTAGTSIFGAISDNDPCGGDTTSDAAKKKVKSIQYEYVTPVSGTQSKRVGYSVKTTTMCNPAGNTTEYIYDTCEPLAASDNCKSGTTYKPYYKCHKQMYDATSANASNREYNACDPLSAAVALSSAVANKLDSDVTFTTGTYDNKDYILMSAGGVTGKPVVPVESLQGASALELWKEQQTDNTTCQKLFSKDCNALGLTEFMQDISDYGTWAREELQDNPDASANDLSRSSYRATLQPCQGGITLTPNGTDGSGGNKYTMTCTE